MNTKTIIHLLSGGLDSVTMLHDLKQQGHRVHCVLFDYKQPHAQELQFAKWHCRVTDTLYTTMDIPRLGGMDEQSWIVPNRNAIMLSLAVNLAAHAGADTVTIGCNADDEAAFPDCRKGFIDAMNQTVKAAGYNVEICAPYLDKKKWQIGDLARQFGVDGSQIWTCYKGGVKPCGVCPACQKLEVAFK